MKNILSALKWFFKIINENFKYKNIEQYNIPKFSNKFKAMTFNIRRDSYTDGDNNWMYRKESCVRMIKDQYPDFICMQEVMPHQFKYFISKIGNMYNYHSAEIVTCHRLDKTILFPSEGNVIFYNKYKYELIDKGSFWLTEKYNKFGRSFGNKTPMNCVWVKLKNSSTGKYIKVFATHLDFGDLQKPSVEIINNMVHESIDNVYICGDMNTNYDSNNLKLLNDNFYNSGNNITDITPMGTFNGFNCRQNKIIDMIFNNVENYKCEVLTDGYGVEFLSDHYPVIIK